MIANIYCKVLLYRMALLTLLFFCGFNVSAQQVVIMPRQGIDTLYVSTDTCYTILDPGGTGNYMHNEDSWLLIISRDEYSGFSLQGEYDLGSEYYGADYLDVYYDTSTTSGYANYAGKGTMDAYRNRTLLHLHTNNYAAFTGFSLQIKFDRTIGSYTETIVNDSTLLLSWDDYNQDATMWSVQYWNNIGDTLVETTTTKSVTLTGLEHNTYYQYAIENDAVPCMREEFRSIKMPCDSGIILMPLSGSELDTLNFGRCYHIHDAAGSGQNVLSAQWGYLTLRTREGNGFYVRSTDTLEVDYLYLEQQTPTSSRAIWINEGRHNSFYQYFPKGEIRINNERIQSCSFEVLQENDILIQPTVSNITATSATISWTDNSASDAWTFRYGYYEGGEQTLHLTTPTVNLSGLLPGRQYVYSIEGNDTSYSCVVPARHGFITTTSPDTVIMPYRGVDTLTIDPTMCYTILDPGGTGNYFHTDWSTLVIRSADGNGFRLTGHYNMHEGDELTFIDGDLIRTCSGTSNFFEYVCNSGILILVFTSDARTNRIGFEFQINPYNTPVHNIQASNITTTTATITWRDTSTGANSWTIQYGADEDAMQTVTAATTSLTLTNLLPGTQYVYSVKNDEESSACITTLRQAFITEGLPAGVTIMPYRGIDTLFITDTCYNIYDAGGVNHNFFNNDTSYLVLISPTGEDFFVTVDFEYNGQDDHALRSQGYDGNDYISFFLNPNDEYAYANYDGYYNKYYQNDNELPRIQSNNGYLKIRFTSNSRIHRRGFHLSVDRDYSQIRDIKFHRITATEARITWSDDNNSSWRVWYGPQNGSQQYADVTTNQITLTGLTPATDYILRITNTLEATPCGARVRNFSTLEANSIVMGYKSIDTVIIQPYNCYMVYDPGGNGDYFGNDSSLLLIKTPNGEPFRLYGYGNVGNTDEADKVRFSTDTAQRYWWEGGYYWWEVDLFCDQGVALISMVTNEAFHEDGFVLKLQYYPSIYNVDTINPSDSAVTITWQDTSSATEWTVTYGPSEDSMTTVIQTDTTTATLTSLRRNQQFYYRIDNNASYQQCMMPSIYGVVMPHDENLIIMPYSNYNLERAGRADLYNLSHIYVAPGHCYTVYDDGVNNNMFSGQEGWRYLTSTDGRGLTIEGSYHYYNDASLDLSNNRNSAWYSNFGYAHFYSNDGYIAMYHRTHRDGEICYSPGYTFNLFMNYPIYNIRTDSATCTSVTLRWDDTSSATQWTIAYGPAERQLDTVTTTQQQLNLTNLEPDHQYVCYFYSNDTTGGDCVRPVKYTFITTCDTNIIILPYNCNNETRILDINGCYTVLDPGASNDYFYQDNISYHLQSNTGDDFIMRGTYKFGENDYLNIWDDNGNHIFGASSNSEGKINLQSKGGRIYLEYVSDADTAVSEGFSFNIRFQTVLP